MPVTQAEAARAFNVSERTQRSAEAVFDASADLHRAVKNDDLSVHAAEKIAKLPEPHRAAAIEKVKRGEIEGAKVLTKAGRTEASNKPKDGDRKAAKTFAKDAASAEVTTAPVVKKTTPTTSSGPRSKKSSGTKQDYEFKGHAAYAPLFSGLDIVSAELPQLSAYQKAHPLAPADAQYLDAQLLTVQKHIESAIQARNTK